MNFKEAMKDELLKRVGFCGVCKGPFCPRAQSLPELPSSIKTSVILAAVEAVEKLLNNPNSDDLKGVESTTANIKTLQDLVKELESNIEYNHEELKNVKIDLFSLMAKF